MAKKRKYIPKSKIESEFEKKLNSEVSDMKAKIDKVIDLNMVEKLLGNNQIEFKFEGTEYIIKRPSFRQKQEANEKRIIKYTEFLKQPQFLLEKDLREIYKQRGIDIEEMEKQYDLMEKQKNDSFFRLGKAIKEKLPDTDLKIMKDEIQSLFSKQQELVMKKTSLLESSIESQVMVYVFTYLAFLMTEKKEGDEWIKAWETYESFLNNPEALINQVVFYTSLLAKNEIPEL